MNALSSFVLDNFHYFTKGMYVIYSFMNYFFHIVCVYFMIHIIRITLLRKHWMQQST